MTEEEFQALAGFRYALRRFLVSTEEASRRAGITPQQYQALLAIRGFPGRNQLTIGELAERLKVRHHSVVGLVDRLVSQGLLLRRPGIDDRRLVYVGLTKRGAELLDTIAAAQRDQVQRMAPELQGLLARLTGEPRAGS